jgi:hypothetical protein
VADIDKKPTEYNWVEYLMYILFCMVNFPLLFRKIEGDELYSIYFSIYFALVLGLALINPLGILTTLQFSLWLIWIGTPFLFVILKSLTVNNNVLSGILSICMVLLLSLSMEQMVRLLSTDSSIYPYSIVYAIYYIVGYLICMRKTPVDFSKLEIKIKNIYLKLPSINLILAGEVLVIFLFLYIRTIMKKYYGGNMLVHDPIPLNTVTSYKVTDENYQYTTSFWLYLEAVSPSYRTSSSEYTNVLLYGHNVLVSYNTSNNTLRITIKGKDTKHKFDVTPKLQKWNQFVLVYANGTFDIFVNGELQDTTNIIPLPSTHDIILGSEGGVRGQVCSLLYYTKVVPSTSIAQMYTQFKEKNPPVV